MVVDVVTLGFVSELNGAVDFVEFARALTAAVGLVVGLVGLGAVEPGDGDYNGYPFLVQGIAKNYVRENS